MPLYKTLDFLANLTKTEMLNAPNLTFSITDQKIDYSFDEFNENSQSIFSWTGKKGISYMIFSSSISDPFFIKVYDNLGSAISMNTENILDDKSKLDIEWVGTDILF